MYRHQCGLGSILGIASIVLLFVGRVQAEQLPSFEKAARELQATTVTVRVSLFPNRTRDAGETRRDEHAEPASGKDAARAKNRVTVCSGVSLGGALIVAPVFAASDSQIRITLPDGQQAEARLRVIDEYSGLSLLQAGKVKLPSISLAKKEPAVGAWVLSAAAWGVEKPVVALGIVSATNRSLAGLSYPPLLQCNLPTAETSSGAGVVDRDGNLLGIIVAADSDQSKRGWNYAIPVRHIVRLQRVLGDSSNAKQVIVLKRRRPIVGMVLEGNAGRILVKRVHENSPAQKAGIRVGNQVLEADGIKIRSVYQAVRPVLNRQPGDAISFRIAQGETIRNVEVVLGGGIVLPSAPFEQLGQVIRPKLDIDGISHGRVVRTNARGSVKEVYSSPNENEPRVPATADEKIKLLEKALEGYRNVIIYQQAQLGDNAERQAETDLRIEQLRKEIEALKKK